MTQTEDPLNLSYTPAFATAPKNQQPHCPRFNDVYFNDQGGLAESQYVFLQANQLSQRWQHLNPEQTFCIAETGFGTGLNFLAVLQAWQQRNSQTGRLHFISVEKFPLDKNSLRLAHQCFPELTQFSQQLLTIWDCFQDSFRAGFHHFQLPDNVSLSLGFGDATRSFSQLEAKVDAWFLDGFAPKKNPDMWHADLFDEITRLSKPGTTLSTFTAASAINKALTAQGFEVQKPAGFAQKREMIKARFITDKTHQPLNIQPWHPWPQTVSEKPAVTVLGAGIAGLCMAHQMKKLGYTTTLIDLHPTPMQQASGNELAMVMPMLTVKDSPEALLYLRAYEMAVRFYQSTEFKAIGVQQAIRSDQQHSWAALIEQAKLPKQLLQLEVTADHCQLHYPQAGYVQTDKVGQRLLADVDQWITADVQRLSSNQNGVWQLYDVHNKVIHNTELLVLANGIDAHRLCQPADLSLVGKHGMTTTIKTPANIALKHILLNKGYVIPQLNKQQWLLGATFDHLPPTAWSQPAQLDADHALRNFTLWQNHPWHSELCAAEVLHGHAAIRATTPDHLPLCGPLINQAQFKHDYQDLHHGRHWQNYPAAEPLKNLYILNGLGSRGFTSAPLLAQYLSAMINGDPLPLETDLCKIIHPNRFLYRHLKKPPKA